MKKLSFLFMAFLVMSCSALKYEPPTNTTISVEPVVKVYSLEGSKDELYVRANKWMVQNFNNAKSVVQFSDKESGVVSGKYLIGTVEKISNSASYSIASITNPKDDVFAIIGIDVKDGAAKITLTPQTFTVSESKYWTNTGIITEEGVKTGLTGLVTSFEDYMMNNTETF